MATLLSIISEKQQKDYDSVPSLTKSERPIAFMLPEPLIKRVNRFRSLENKVGFIIQAGYFRITGRFFPVTSFGQIDIDYVSKMFGSSKIILTPENYPRARINAHRAIILDHFKWTSLSDNKDLILEQAQWFCNLQLKAHEIFYTLAKFCWDSKIEVPSYHYLSKIISELYIEFEQQKISIIEEITTEEHYLLFKELTTNEQTLNNDGRLPSLLTILQESLNEIKAEQLEYALKNYRKIKRCFYGFTDILSALQLSDSAIQYFAEWIRKAKSSQIIQFNNPHKTHLYITAFIADEIKLRTDMLVEVFLLAEQRARNTANRKAKELIVLEKKDSHAHRKRATLSHLGRIDIHEVIKHHLFFEEYSSDEERVYYLKKLFVDYENFEPEKIVQREEIQEVLKKIIEEERYSMYLKIMTEKEPSISKQLNPILMEFEFDFLETDEALKTAIQSYQNNKGAVTASSPKGFLSEKQEKLVSGETLNKSLYRIFLFRAISEAIRSGTLNLIHSYEYKSLEHFLIPKEKWDKERKKLIKMAGLQEIVDCKDKLNELKQELDILFTDVNERIANKKNKLVRRVKNGRYSPITPGSKTHSQKYISSLISSEDVQIFRVLQEVDNITGFTSQFKHYATKNVKGKPDQATILAGIIANGCNIGIGRLAKSSQGIQENSLRNTVKWFFTRDSLHNANSRVMKNTNKLSLPSLYSQNNEIHTSSDGRKVTVSLESLQARFSHKYFGKNKGVSVYTFVDSRQQIFFADVISSADREASFVIDGLLHNKSVKSAMHSTDSHGCTEVVFGLTHLLDIFLAPRIAKIGKHSIYTMSQKTYNKREELTIQPSGVIQKQLIERQWDNILRFIATIKLRYATAAQMANRLNSYSDKHPLYEAMKQFGRIIKSVFVLKYYDNLELRKRIQWVLNHGELSHKFARAIAFDNAGEFIVRSKEQQRIVVLCQTLIQNCVIYWNYLYLSQLLLSKKDPQERARMIGLLRQSSIMTWKHIIWRGIYDFRSDETIEVRFDIEKIIRSVF